MRITIRSKFGNSTWPTLIILAFIVLCTNGCSSIKGKPESVSILAAVPMSHTSISSYLSIDTIYKSDNNILLIAVWGRVSQSEGHTITWEVFNNNGDKILSLSKDDFTIRPHMWAYFPVSMKTIEKSDIGSGQLIIHFFIDEKLAMTKKVNYENKEIVSQEDQRVVILPFIEYSNYPHPWPESTKNVFQNTVADALYCEIGRIFPDTIPHYVAEQKIGRVLGVGCSKSMECINFLKGIFGESIFIFGELSMQKVDLDASSLSVYVYNPKMKEIKNFHFFKNSTYNHALLMNDMLKSVLYKEGMMDYLLGK